MGALKGGLARAPKAPGAGGRNGVSTGEDPVKDAAIIAALVVLLASSHLVLSSRTVRARLVARLGERAFLAAYSLVALVFFVPLFHHYFTHRHLGPQLWTVPDSGPVELALVLANTIGVVMLVSGLADPGPGSFLGKPREGPTGVYRVTGPLLAPEGRSHPRGERARWNVAPGAATTSRARERRPRPGRAR